ncbi:hypothetical protein [uncultured Winogradskyella sp.]|uniref:hypothetical protein n=1 Tax=uncultured Winogradskyella sp. TaxID=395353 RepID=UPI00260955A7|nr:hypothetical protein [uncultured Winogradskyella sp.]
MRNLIILSILFCFAFKAECQTDLNNYKYVVVPLQYDFLKGQDVYRLNTLTKFLFKKSKFDVYFEKQEFPEDLFKDRCMALYVDVKNVDGGFRKTRLEITLRDCKGELIFKSDVGQSGENNHEKRHQIALRSAFKSIETLNYKYHPILKDESKTTEKAKELKKVEEIVESKPEEIIESENKIETPSTKSEKQPVIKEKENLLLATTIDNGYQIVDQSNKDVMILLSTAAENVFIVKGKDAIVFKENGKWVYSENDGDVMSRKFLSIIF